MSTLRSFRGAACAKRGKPAIGAPTSANHLRDLRSKMGRMTSALHVPPRRSKYTNRLELPPCAESRSSRHRPMSHLEVRRGVALMDAWYHGRTARRRTFRQPQSERGHSTTLECERRR